MPVAYAEEAFVHARDFYNKSKNHEWRLGKEAAVKLLMDEQATPIAFRRRSYMLNHLDLVDSGHEELQMPVSS